MPLDGLAPSSHSQLAAVSVSHTASHARNGLRAREGAVSGGALVMVAKRKQQQKRSPRLWRAHKLNSQEQRVGHGDEEEQHAASSTLRTDASSF